MGRWDDIGGGGAAVVAASTEELGNIEDETLESLQAKHAEYKESLAGVKDALKLTPEEPELIRLAADIQELVSLYNDLVILKKKSAGLDEDVEESVSISDSLVRTVPDNVPVDLVSQHLDEYHQSTSLSSAVSLRALLCRSCYAKYEGLWYTAVVTDVHPPPLNPRNTANAIVAPQDFLNESQPSLNHYFVFSNDETGGREPLASFRLERRCLFFGSEKVPVNEVKFLPSLPSLPANAACWAIAAHNGLWHQAVVIGKPDLSRGGYVVRFRQTPAVDAPLETQFVKFDQVALRTPSLCVAGSLHDVNASSKTAKFGGGSANNTDTAVKDVVTPGGYRIPEKLVIQPQDSEKLKQTKKRKIQVIKREQRRDMIESEAREKAASWKAHTSKVGSRQQLRSSIFKTAEGIDAKVGVIGSGQRMTTFQHRTKHIFNEEEDDD